MKLLLAMVLLAALGLAGCLAPVSTGRRSSVLNVPPEADAARHLGLSTEDRARARQLYTAKCAQCHRFYHPGNYGDVEWQRWMTKMGKKARLKPEQERLLSSYLDTLRAKPVSRGDAHAESKP